MKKGPGCHRAPQCGRNLLAAALQLQLASTEGGAQGSEENGRSEDAADNAARVVCSNRKLRVENAEALLDLSIQSPDLRIKSRDTKLGHDC